MDLTLVRALLTLVLFCAFILLVYWVYHPRQKLNYENIAAQAIADDLAIDADTQQSSKSS